MATPLLDIQGRDDIEVLVRKFYHRAFADDLLGPIFIDIAQMDLEHHMPIMCDFWQTVLFRAGLYRRNALQLHVALHAKANLAPHHFDRWLSIWTSTVDELFAGEKAELAKQQAGRVGASILNRLQGGSGSAFETISSRREADV